MLLGAVMPLQICAQVNPKPGFIITNVTRRLNVTGEPELYFAEFMVQGKMNLYCVARDSKEYFFFEREDGEMKWGITAEFAL